MKTLYIECKMGAAGDMITAALLGLFDNPQMVVDELNKIRIPGVEYRYELKENSGIVGGHISVLVNGEEEAVLPEADGNDHEHDALSHHDHQHEANDDHFHHGEHGEEHTHDHHHNSVDDIEEIIENLETTKEIKSDIREVYALIAEAESKVHGKPVSQIHFHEVGNMDAIADVAAVCYLIHKLDPDKIVVSPINVGGGTVRAAHGILPVPAPATAYLLNGIPTYESQVIKSELCTPTGAALIKYFADAFSVQPVMAVDKIGYGMGKKKFPQVNAVRVMLGETNDESDQIVELCCDIDDMTAEELGFSIEKLFEEGALDAYTITVGMKKNRPGTELHCICKMDDRDHMLKQMFLHTTTLGIRENICNRYVLNREIKKMNTPYGDIRIKKSYGYDVTRVKMEYDDLAGIARRTGKSIMELKKELSE